MNLNSEVQPFTPEQIQAACAAMLEVARADGIAPSETALIGEFWTSAGDSLGKFDSAMNAPFRAGLFADTAQKVMIVDLCLACAFADGRYSDNEKQVVSGITTQLGLTNEFLIGRVAEVRAQFLGSLAHLPDPQSVAALAKDLS